MHTENYVAMLPILGSKVGIALTENWRGIDSVLPFIDMIRRDGSVFLLKFDGQRAADDNGQFTVVVSSGALQDDPIRIDANTLEEALAFGIIKYAEAVWL